MDGFVDRYDKNDKFYFVGYNAKFDADHLRAWFQKNKDDYFGSWFWNPPLDVMSFAAFGLMRRRASLRNFQLLTVAEALGIATDKDNAHDALYDVELTRNVFQLLIERVRKK